MRVNKDGVCWFEVDNLVLYTAIWQALHTGIFLALPTYIINSGQQQ